MQDLQYSSMNDNIYSSVSLFEIFSNIPSHISKRRAQLRANYNFEALQMCCLPSGSQHAHLITNFYY